MEGRIAMDIASFNNINVCLTDREVKGYNFEVRVNSILKDTNIDYLSNPLDSIQKWKSNIKKGSDFKIPYWNWEIEAKYSEAKIFPSWINRDWIPRFDSNSHSLKVIVHNKEMKLPINSMELCFLHDVYLVEVDSLRYVLRTKMKGNKVIEPNKANKASKESDNLEGKRRKEGNKLIEANRTNKRNGNKPLEVKNKSIESSIEARNTDNNKKDNSVGLEVNSKQVPDETKGDSHEDNKEAHDVYESIKSIKDRASKKGYTIFTIDELRKYFTIKNNYISNNIQEPKFYYAFYGKILKYAIYNWINLCRFCRDYPCFYIEYHNGVKDGNFYLLGDAEQSKTYMNIIDKIHKCLRKRLYLFFFKNYTYFNTSIPEDRTINENKKNPQTTIIDYIGDTI